MLLNVSKESTNYRFIFNFVTLSHIIQADLNLGNQEKTQFFSFYFPRSEITSVHHCMASYSSMVQAKDSAHARQTLSYDHQPQLLKKAFKIPLDVGRIWDHK